MPENKTSQTVPSVEKKSPRPFRVRAIDGYQPLRELTSKPPRGRSGVPNPVPARSAKDATGA